MEVIMVYDDDAPYTDMALTLERRNPNKKLTDIEKKYKEEDEEEVKNTHEKTTLSKSVVSRGASEYTANT